MTVDVDLALERMHAIEGWFEEDEARLLIRLASRVMAQHGPGPLPPLVEVGSYLGRSTVVLGTIAQTFGTVVYAIDPHEGNMGPGVGGGYGPTFERFAENLHHAGVISAVIPLVARSREPLIPDLLSLVLIDGSHDYANVRDDFAHFAPLVVPDGFVAFHDYRVPPSGRQHYDVMPAVDDILAEGEWERVGFAEGLIALGRKGGP